MDLVDIIDFFEATSVKTVRVSRPSEDKDNLDIIVEDDISSFLACLNSFEIPIVFIYVESCDEGDFETKSNRYGDYEPINLINIDSKLKPFTKHIGEQCMFELSALIGNRMIKTLISTDWWDKFNILKEKALQYIQEQDEQFYQQIEQEQATESEKQQKELNALLKKLQAMHKNQGFCDFVLQSRQSLRAILIYALELLPELSDIDEKVLKDEIATLTDKIRVKKSMK